MKRLIAIILMVFIISTTAYGSSFLPSGFDTEQSGVYFRPYVFDADNCVEFYVEGLNLHYKMTPNERINYIKLVIKTSNMATIRTVSANMVGEEITGVLDLSYIQNTTSTLGHIVEITLVDKNNNSTTFSSSLYKNSASVTYQEPAYTYANKNYESFYKDLPAETIEYYKSDYTDGTADMCIEDISFDASDFFEYDVSKEVKEVKSFIWNLETLIPLSYSEAAIE